MVEHYGWEAEDMHSLIEGGALLQRGPILRFQICRLYFQYMLAWQFNKKLCVSQAKKQVEGLIIKLWRKRR